MKRMKKTYLLLFIFLSLGQLVSQNVSGKSYWIFTNAGEIKDYKIYAIAGDSLVINNGWDMKIPIAEIERFALSPQPSASGQFWGKQLGSCVGLMGGFVAGVIVFPQSLGVRNEGINGLRAFIFAGAFAGAYYGKKMAGKRFKDKPLPLVNMSTMTLSEKKKYIQSNLIIN
ncbi:MAG: hypothetical protein ISR82_08260 [Candidatus Marinimicrobia bacterium]|nr:hypothetical protein [Candidatus Neomarinimicrobiota bacterium]MBL7011199.1 hypothetical protein [Candidatus Neomarinimicrobiota bacterium]MBL7031487.1 hypothetical protein [Candidatus Neomarinimicrobiota bacterium]